jgi:Ca-activated chloride channel family protein
VRKFQLLSLLPLLTLAGFTFRDFHLLAQETPRYSTQVEQVVVYASVYDDNMQLVTNLAQDDFTLFEDKVQQQLTSFARTDIPSTIGIVLDSSGSMKGKWRMVEGAVDLFLSQNNPSNELFFIRFDDEVELEEDLTYEPEDIRDAVSNVIVKGGTSLWDALYLAVDKASQGHEPKKVVVVFTDGEDKDSYYKQKEVLDKVQEADTQIFVVAFLDKDLADDKGFFGVFKSQREKVQKEISEVAEVTGGLAFFPESTDELNPAFEAIAYELKNQYRLAYISSNPNRDGNWRKIDVKVKDAKERGLRVRAKKGYFGPKDS